MLSDLSLAWGQLFDGGGDNYTKTNQQTHVTNVTSLSIETTIIMQDTSTTLKKQFERSKNARSTRKGALRFMRTYMRRVVSWQEKERDTVVSAGV
jgi:hypothetical protein